MSATLVERLSTAQERRIPPEWWEGVISSALGVSHLDAETMRRYVPTIKMLGETFTARLKNSVQPALYESHRSCSAYLLYYGIVNALKLHFPLDEWWRGTQWDSARNISVAELGAGPGTGLLGLASWLEHRSGPRAHSWMWLCTDASSRCLSLSRAVAEGLESRGLLHGLTASWQKMEIKDVGSLPGDHDVILGMNMLNELRESEAATLVDRLIEPLKEDGAVILIEPALRETSRRLLQVRDAALQSGWMVTSPCVRQDACPALVKAKDWCHHEEQWDRPGFIEMCDQQLGRVKLSLKYTYLILRRKGNPVTSEDDRQDHQYRVVSERFKEKGRTRMVLCGLEGRRMTRLNTRDRSPRNEAFALADRYDLLRVQNLIDGDEEWGIGV